MIFFNQLKGKFESSSTSRAEPFCRLSFTAFVLVELPVAALVAGSQS